MLILHLRGDSFFSNKQFLNDSILWRNNQVRHSKHFYQHFLMFHPGFNNFMLTTPKKLFHFFRDMSIKCVSFQLKKKSPDCLYFRHSTSPQLPSPQHLFRSSVGQNLWASSGRASNPAVAVAAWHDEIRYYDYDSNTCEPNKACGHYTQVNVAKISNSQFYELIKVHCSVQGIFCRAWQNSRLCKRLNSHPAERALTSDWSVNGFIMVVYENFLSCFAQTVLSD